MVVLYLLLSVIFIVLLTVRFKLHPFIALLLAALGYGFLAGMPLQEIIQAVNEGFGKTLGSIGLIITLGVIIGAFLEKSGGAYAIADAVLRKVGKKRVPLAMGGIGYFVSIPVFADSGFMLLSPLNRSLSKKAKISLSGSAIALAIGLTASHTMVPPTPGPIAAAGILGADLGTVMAVGIPVSIVALLAGVLFATRFVAKTYIDPAPSLTQEDVDSVLQRAPGIWHASLAVVVPIILILCRSVIQGMDLPLNAVTKTLVFFGEPFIALLIGVFISFTLPKKFDLQNWSSEGWLGKALASAASIILITGAGGIFGRMLQKSGIADVMGDALAGLHLSIWLPFLLAAAIKTAQGSSTVALITAASIISPLMETLGFVSGVDKALVVIAIGAGSAVISHANDSFFWVVTQSSSMDVKTGYKFHSLGTLVLGTTAACCVFILHLVL